MGNLGQADYATANGFMDQFAAYRNRQVGAGKRHGRTRSINWPLWQAGGMKIDEGSQRLLQQITGMQPMQTATGIEAFYRALALPYDQVLVVEGNLPQLRRALLANSRVSSESQAGRPAVVAETDSKALIEKTQDYLGRQFSEVLQLSPYKIDPHAPLEDYGIDSVVAMKLTKQLEETFGSLSKTLFFEYQTIAGLAEYFVKTHPGTVRDKFSLPHEGPKGKAVDQTTAERRRSAPAIRGRNRFHVSRTNYPKDIAVIGLSG